MVGFPTMTDETRTLLATIKMLKDRGEVFDLTPMAWIMSEDDLKRLEDHTGLKTTDEGQAKLYNIPIYTGPEAVLDLCFEEDHL